MLGHVLTLKRSFEAEWVSFEKTKKLILDTEVLIGTGRTFRDKEGRRLPQKPKRRDYTYVPFSFSDYKKMIEAGMNYFGLAPSSEKFLRKQPVFYRKPVSRIDYPADLYRSNYLGPVMFIDEPVCRMIGDPTVNTTLWYFSDAATLIKKRARVLSLRAQRKLQKGLRARGISLGDMELLLPTVPFGRRGTKCLFMSSKEERAR